MTKKERLNYLSINKEELLIVTNKMIVDVRSDVKNG